MPIRRPFNFRQWIDEHRHLLKPPVGNQCVYNDDDFIVMVVGGPNSRKDYHWDEGEELFYQLEGDIMVQVQEDGEPVEVPIREGEMFLLPPRIPHNPVRGPNTSADAAKVSWTACCGFARTATTSFTRSIFTLRTSSISFRAFSKNSTAPSIFALVRNAAQ